MRRVVETGQLTNMRIANDAARKPSKIKRIMIGGKVFRFTQRKRIYVHEQILIHFQAQVTEIVTGIRTINNQAFAHPSTSRIEVKHEPCAVELISVTIHISVRSNEPKFLHAK